MIKFKTFWIVFIIFCAQTIVSQENLVNRKGVAEGLPVTPIVTDKTTSKGNGNVGSTTRKNETDKSVNESFLDIAKTTRTTGIEEIPMSSIYKGDRYDRTRPGTDYEQMALNKQQAEFNERRIIAISLIIIIVIVIIAYKKFYAVKGNNSIQNIPKNTNPTNQIITDLERIQQLRKEGVISEEEFNALKRAILS